MTIGKLAQRLSDVGISCEVESKKLIFQLDDTKTTVDISNEWMKEIGTFFRSKQFTFLSESRTLQANRSVEFCLRGLNRNTFQRPDYTFKSSTREKLTICQASKRWMLGFVMSAEFERYAMLALRKRLSRNISRSRNRNLDYILWAPTTARFETPKHFDRAELLKHAKERVESCLLKLAIERDECFDFSKQSREDVRSRYDSENDGELTIPSSTYSSSLAKFYKVAKSSQFPGQAFLSFYHILEYQFYRISDHNLYAKIRGQINNTSFHGGDEDIRHILSIVYKHKQNLDETALLKMVLEHYVDESEFIEFIESLEKDYNNQQYTKKRDIFGEDLFINVTEGHALNNAAKVIKHIRNYLVHSSDKVTRDDRHVPLTKSDDIILDYLPIVEFLAEKVIFGSAQDNG